MPIEATARVLLTEAEAQDLTARIRDSVENLWQLLADAFAGRAWSALGYTSWESYTMAEFGMSRGQAYRLLDQAKVVRELEAAAGVDLPPEAVPSARAAAELKPRLPEVAEKVAERTRGRRKAARPAIVAEVVAEERGNGTAASTPASSAMATDAADLDQANEGCKAVRALLRTKPVDLRALPAQTFARLESHVKQARACRNPVDAAEAGPSTSTQKSPSNCKHPANRRIGKVCMECGTGV